MQHAVAASSREGSKLPAGPPGVAEPCPACTQRCPPPALSTVQLTSCLSHPPAVRKAKAEAVFPRPTAGALRPIVHGQTLRYQAKRRSGRGFTHEELKVSSQTLRNMIHAV
jgi:Ribosomal protein L13e